MTLTSSVTPPTRRLDVGDLTITDVEVVLSPQPAVTPAFRWRDGVPGSEPDRVEGWLVIHTDAGPTGYGHTRRGHIMADLVERRLRPDLVGRNPLHREALFERFWELDRIEEFPIYVPRALDVALWDIAGKVAGMPVHLLLGTARESIPAYASTSTFSSTAEYFDVIDQCLEAGYPAIKLHVWGRPRDDAALAQAVRGHVGDQVPLMFDGSAAYDLIDSVYIGRALSEAGYMYYEEPMREFSINAYRRLAERVDVPLLVAETSDGAHWNTADFIVHGGAAAVRTSTDLRGGFTGAMRIAHLADAFHMRAEVHGGGLPNAHLCMAIGNTTYYESLVTSNPVVREECVDANGMVAAPTAPGVGWEEDWARHGRPAGI